MSFLCSFPWIRPLLDGALKNRSIQTPACSLNINFSRCRFCTSDCQIWKNNNNILRKNSIFNLNLNETWTELIIAQDSCFPAFTSYNVHLIISSDVQYAHRRFRRAKPFDFDMEPLILNVWYQNQIGSNLFDIEREKSKLNAFDLR